MYYSIAILKFLLDYPANSRTVFFKLEIPTFQHSNRRITFSRKHRGWHNEKDFKTGSYLLVQFSLVFIAEQNPNPIQLHPNASCNLGGNLFKLNISMCPSCHLQDGTKTRPKFLSALVKYTSRDLK